MNDCKFVGNLAEDIKVTTVKLPNDGTSKSKGTIKLAVNDFNRKPLCIEFTVWGKTAENAAKYLKKGMPAVIKAHTDNNDYEKNGVKVHSYEFTADEVEFISSKKPENSNKTN